MEPTDRSSTTWEFVAHGEAETERLGTALGESLDAGSVVALIGNLGAGKTRLVQSIATAMGVDRLAVSSPTFILIQEYTGRLPIYHFDTYRLRDSDEFLELGADELLTGEGVCLVEWADRVADVLPADVLRIEIEIAGQDERRFSLIASGPRSQATIDRARTKIARA